MKFVKETSVTEYQSKLVKWWLMDGTKHLPKLFILKGAYRWDVYDENDNLLFEARDEYLRTKKQAIEWIEGYDAQRDIEIAREEALELERVAKHEAQRKLENDYNESFKCDVNDNFTAKIGDKIDVKMFTLSKLSSLGDGYAYDLSCDYNQQVSKAKIEKIKVVTQAEYDEFVDSFFSSSISSSFSGGGTCIDSEEINKYNSYMELPKELREYYNKHCYDLVTIVIADKRKPIVINPHGFTYARYAGVVV